MTSYDLKYVRSQFPALSGTDAATQVFCENAGGSFPCQQTISALHHFYEHNKVQPYHPHILGEKAGHLMDEAYDKWAIALNVSSDEVIFGPSTTANTYMLAQSLSHMLQEGDEIIVTNTDHEANSGAIRRMAKDKAVKILEWQVNVDEEALNIEDLIPLLSERTALICMPHCSNILGAEHPIKDWISVIRQSCAGTSSSLSAKTPIIIVDGVSHVPHEIPDVSDLGADIYLFSLYKVYSVHQGVMVVRHPILMDLPNQGHFFNNHLPHYRLNPAGPDHAQIGSAAAVLDYISQVAAHHGVNDNLRKQITAMNKMWHDHEQELMQPLLDYLAQSNKVKLIGAHKAQDRHPTISFLANQPSEEIARSLGEQGVMAGAGHFYAYRLIEALGHDPNEGVTRISLVHYNSAQDVEQICKALDTVL